jgi:transcriptional pleiotropic repressor
MELLEKTRRINKLLQNADTVDYHNIAKLLGDLIQSNVYIADKKGKLKGYALIRGFECDTIRDSVLDTQQFPEDYHHYIMGVRDTKANIPHDDRNCSFVADTKCMFMDKMTTIIPIYGKGERLGTLIVGKYNDKFNEEDLLLSEYAGTVLGVEILHEREVQFAEEARNKAMVQIAFDTLSYSEMEAVAHMLVELKGDEGLLVASKIADSVGITRSVIVNALRKFESAGLLDTKSLGMKGTYIRVLNPFVFEELKKRYRF